MRIGIDCRMWNTTTGRVVRETVKRITDLDKENEYVLFFLKDDIEEVSFPENFKVVEADIIWHSFAEQLRLPFIFLKEKLDLLHVPHFNLPIFYPKKFIVTIHDLTILRVNTGRASTRNYLFYKIKRLGFKIALSVAVWRSEKITTVSNYVKKDIIKTFKVKEDKVVVIPNAVSEKFKHFSDEEVEKVLPKYNIKKPYLFYVGNAHPHKNLEGLLEAFKVVSEKHPSIQLVLGGKKDYFYSRLESEWKDSKIFEKINFTGFLDDADLPKLFSGSEMFVNPSLYEGFGLQLLEAFSCDTKVVCSNTTSLPEVGGDAAIYFDPRDPKDIAEKILKSLDDSSTDHIAKGHSRVKSYSWTRSARQVLDLYEAL